MIAAVARGHFFEVVGKRLPRGSEGEGFGEGTYDVFFVCQKAAGSRLHIY